MAGRATMVAEMAGRATTAGEAAVRAALDAVLAAGSCGVPSRVRPRDTPRLVSSAPARKMAIQPRRPGRGRPGLRRPGLGRPGPLSPGAAGLDQPGLGS